jgi:hypothetical protein
MTEFLYVDDTAIVRILDLKSLRLIITPHAKRNHLISLAY